MNVVNEVNLLTVPEAARIAHCSEPTIRRLVYKGEIPAVQAGPKASLRIPAAAFNVWLGTGEVNADA